MFHLKSIKIKETYLLFIIVIGLISLSIYTTYALFTASTEIENVVDFTASITTDSSVLEYEMVRIAAGETKIIEVNVINNYEQQLYYGVWYEIVAPTDDTSSLTIGTYTEKDDTPSSGTISASTTLTVLVGITNTSSSEAIINLGTAGSLTSNLGLSDNRILVPEGWSQSLTSAQVLTKLGLTVNSGTPDFSKTSCSSGCGEATVGIYAAEDDLGTSYYFRGDVTNNYVKFAGFYWRIIRINGDGTIRMIYAGTSAHANGDTSTDNCITLNTFGGGSSFNSSGSNAYVGYMYGTADSLTYAAEHANTNNSTIKGNIDSWYSSNLSSYSDYIADAIYCNDRNLYSGLGYGTTNSSHYSAYGRLASNKSPTLKCANANDKFTTNSNVDIGNGSLTYSIGLITADEISMAGTIYDSNSSTTNTSYYLYVGTDYWTMTPHNHVVYVNMEGQTDTFVFISDETGTLYINSTQDSFGFVKVRPVISLIPEAIQYGTGISTDPFRVTIEI